MTTPRKTITTLFPVEHPAVAIYAKFTEPGTTTTSSQNSNLTYSYSYSLPGHYSSRQCSYPCDTVPYILPNGIFFHQSYFGDGKKRMMIENQLYENISYKMDGHTTITQPILPHTATILTDSPFIMKIACINQNQNEIFLYELTHAKPDRFFHSEKKYMHLKVQARTEKKEPIPDRSIYKTKSPEIKIISMAGLKSISPGLLAVALSDSKIKLLEVNGYTNVKIFCSIGDYTHGKSSSTIQLLSSSYGLIAYHEDINQLTIWKNLNDAKDYKNYTLPSLFQLKMSSNGEYLTGVERSKDEKSIDTSKVGFCFELKTGISHRISFKEPASDFVIGFQNQVCLLDKDKNIVQISLKELIEPKRPGIKDKIKSMMGKR